MGALLGLQLMPRNEGRGSQLWGGRGEKKENGWNTSGELGKVGERQMCFQEKRREEKLCFRTLSPHIKSLPRWFDRGILCKMYTQNKNAVNSALKQIAEGLE